MAQKSIEQTYYQILELSPNAGQQDIVGAYHRAKLAYSPDSPALYTMFTKEEANELLKLIEEAFRVLSNQNSRREYDNILLTRKNQPTAEDLPDFAPSPEIPTPAPTIVAPPKEISNPQQQTIASQTSGAIPPGFAKSRLSIYEVKEAMEREIQSQEIIDGSFIKKVRTYKNINLDQLSRETRISRSYLSAIENDDFEALPAPVFLRGFIIQLARHLGLDETRSATSYLSRAKK